MNYKEVYKFPTITDKSHVVKFGKHKNKSIGELIDTEPEYLLWCLERGILDLDHKLIGAIYETNPWLGSDPCHTSAAMPLMPSKPMTKAQFKKRWDGDADGDGITFDEIAECAKEWGLFATPRIANIDRVRYAVLKAANVNDCEDYNPALWEDED